MGDLEIDIGHGVSIWWASDVELRWRHPRCRAWHWLAIKPDPRSTGHKLVIRDPLTVEGSLLCPAGCGTHGVIRDGRWEPC